jgi:hypothetical protein
MAASVWVMCVDMNHRRARCCSEEEMVVRSGLLSWGLVFKLLASSLRLSSFQVFFSPYEFTCRVIRLGGS